MTIDSDAIGTPLPRPNGVFPFVDVQTGALTTHGIELLNAWHRFILGMNRLTPCNASGTNTITLTPLDASPVIEKYVDFEVFTFVAANTSTGDITATVVPTKGTLGTLKVYVDGGSTQATTGDVTQNRLYFAIYNDALDGGAGGFVLK